MNGMCEARADSEKISVVLEIRGDAEMRKWMRNKLLKTLQEFRDNSTVRGACMIQTEKSIQKLEIGAGT
ncbi:MAG: hypothetical protein HDT20_04430 [Oscillibacter sp.]|nr:hypothetical protein [Oscillibacter sp.]